MSFGDQLYVPSPRDILAVDSAPARLVFRATSSLAAASITLPGLTVPGDEVWRVDGVSLLLDPGAGQTNVFASMLLEDLAGSAGFIARVLDAGSLEITGPADGGQALRFAVNILVMPGERIVAAADFSAGAAVNSLFFSYWGIRLPRGNLLK